MKKYLPYLNGILALSNFYFATINTGLWSVFLAFISGTGFMAMVMGFTEEKLLKDFENRMKDLLERMKEANK